MTFQLAPNQRAAATGISGPESDPMAFTNCASDRLREYFPSSDTSRMKGLPATCKMAAPAPMSRMVIRNPANDVTAKVAFSRPTSATARPSSSTNFLPR
jgi:hypothetical protein